MKKGNTLGVIGIPVGIAIGMAGNREKVKHPRNYRNEHKKKNIGTPIGIAGN